MFYLVAIINPCLGVILISDRMICVRSVCILCLKWGTDMFSKLKLEISSLEPITYQKASAFQGVLFEYVDREYVDMLHTHNLHPYSQYLLSENGKIYWVINTLNEESYEKIIRVLLSDDFTNFSLKSGNVDVTVINKEVETVAKSNLIYELNNVHSERYFDIRMISPMTFKQKGIYICYPDIRLIFQSIMNKYSAISEDMIMFDEDTLNQITDSSIITKYNLRSTVFSMESITIPGAIGNMRIKVNGPEVMARYVRLLFRFSEYSGIGAKTGLGMGAVNVDVGGGR